MLVLIAFTLKKIGEKFYFTNEGQIRTSQGYGKDEAPITS
jgi:hypothetical protein